MSLSRILILWKKECRHAFFSPLIYVLSAVFCIIIGWLFFNYIVYAKELDSATITQSVITPIFGNMNFIFLFLAPLLAMGSLAEELANNSIDLLEMSHLTLWDIIIGKYLALFTHSLFMISFTVLFPVVLALSGFSDWGLIASSYLGIVLSIAAYLAVSLFASSICRNQLVAALLGFAFLMGFLLLSLSVNATGNVFLGHFFKYMSIPYHYEKFLSGAVTSYSLVFFLSFIFFFLFLSKRVLAARRW